MTSVAQPGIVAPYITEWSEESCLDHDLVERRGFGIAYADESVVDRDDDHVLWLRTKSRPREGRPLFGRVHPYRQRRAMRRMLCQVCGGPSTCSRDGALWLLQDHREDWTDWPERMAVTEPPVCLPCVATSNRLCPALRKSSVVVLAKESPVVGVYGMVYRSGHPSPIPTGKRTVGFDDPAIQWVVAASLLRELRGCSIV
ncbi:hypothetical protein KIPE111705_03415 [Kibdelosporangium persicum]|uniref:hypothetical protein n=1 Tax=Kibdelosporangium persicum TaxID=2698649 RepID=UPI001C256323|nr:hypothetical protein [Kibdelosporangium persicum]